MEKLIQVLLLLTIWNGNNAIKLMELLWTLTREMQVAFGFKPILLILLEYVM